MPHFLSIPTLNETLSRKLEPRTASPKRRLAVLQGLRAQGVVASVSDQLQDAP